MVERNTGLIKSVLTAADVLFFLAKMQGEVTPSELGSEMGIGKVKAYRYLNSLEAGGLVSRNIVTGRYSLSWGVVSLGKAALEESDLAKIADPFMRRLSVRTEQTVVLHAWDKGEVVVINIARSQNAINILSELGSRLRPAETASGRVFLAMLPEQTVADYIKKGLDEFPHLREELEKIRQDGYAIFHDSMVKGLTGVSAPVLSFTGSIEAALTVVGFTQNLESLGHKYVAEQVVQTALEISQQLGANRGNSSRV